MIQGEDNDRAGLTEEDVSCRVRWRQMIGSGNPKTEQLKEDLNIVTDKVKRPFCSLHLLSAGVIYAQLVNIIHIIHFFLVILVVEECDLFHLLSTWGKIYTFSMCAVFQIAPSLLNEIPRHIVHSRQKKL